MLAPINDPLKDRLIGFTFMATTDVSSFGAGGVLSQLKDGVDLRAVYFSEQLKPFEQELLVIKLCLEVWRHRVPLYIGAIGGETIGEVEAVGGLSFNSKYTTVLEQQTSRLTHCRGPLTLPICPM
ncbi:hypothetical protein GN958_ATG16189 [Phytophthora infestans]|uniref:Reverse transcriptase/retrotransposon-derived protein RNase H-like domain-containing protein n=1 Tax=Phytophthora infestans TaxID=4787 RepID=A0A8S9U4Q2_PHYIN|nr:hypothetical protein GN958_ATG16189 [Phytophthora infestans]